MSLISKHSGASAGIIYHYFESKEDLMQSLYYRIKEDMSRAIVAADDPKQLLAKRFQTLWLSIFRYCLTHLQAMAFLEQYESMPIAKQREPWLLGEMQTLDDLLAYIHEQNMTESLPFEAKMLYGLIADLRAQDLIKDLPLVAIGEFTLGTALRLARQAAAGLMTPHDATLTEIAKACWDAITR
jgi:AcrR family transcriptional regulator